MTPWSVGRTVCSDHPNRTPLAGWRANGRRLRLPDESADIACGARVGVAAACGLVDPGAHGPLCRTRAVSDPPGIFRNMKPIQQELPLPLWGGARRGAGRKRKSLARVSHTLLAGS